MDNYEISTIDVYNGIIDALKNDGSLCKAYSAYDISACLYADIGDCTYFLLPEEISELREMADYHSGNLVNYLKTSNSVKAIQTISDMKSMLESLPEKREIERLNFELTMQRHIEFNTAIVIGDSHSCVFSGNEVLTLVSIGNTINVCPDKGNKPFTAIHLGPCLAYNSCNYGTTNHFLEKFDYITSTMMASDDKIIVSLGEIDIRSHVFKEVDRQKCLYSKVIDDICSNYTRFLLAVKANYPHLYVYGPIATQKDIYPEKATFPRIGSEYDRNKATKYFTEKMSDFCEKNGIGFLSIFDQMVDNNLMTKEDFMGPDHEHVCQAAYPSIIGLWEKLK